MDERDASSEQARNVSVNFLPPGQDAKLVRFRGTTFLDLKQRLNSARVPGLQASSYIEVYVPGEGFICLLDKEVLPVGDLTVRAACLDARELTGEPVLGVPGPGAGWTGLLAGAEGSTGGRYERRLAKHVRKLDKLDCKMQAKVHKMYNRLEKHGRFYSPPENREMDHAMAFPVPPPLALPLPNHFAHPPHRGPMDHGPQGHRHFHHPTHQYPGHHHHHPHHFRHDHPHAGQPAEHFEQDPSGAGTVAEPVEACNPQDRGGDLADSLVYLALGSSKVGMGKEKMTP